MLRPSLLVVALCAVLSTGCATHDPDVISRQQAMAPQSVQDAVVLSVRPVRIDGTQSGVGAVTGAVVGGIAGGGLGGSREGKIGTVLGAVVLGSLGNAIERSATSENAVELIVRTVTGQRLVLVQAQGQHAFREGEQVLLVQGGGQTRVVPAR